LLIAELIHLIYVTTLAKFSKRGLIWFVRYFDIPNCIAPLIFIEMNCALSERKEIISTNYSSVINNKQMYGKIKIVFLTNMGRYT